MLHHARALLAIILSMSLAGCAPVDFLDFVSLLNPGLLDSLAGTSSFVGEDDRGRILLALRTEPYMLGSQPDLPEYDIYAIDPNDSESELVFEAVQAFAYEIRANAGDIAWNDSAKGDGVVRSLLDGREFRVPLGPSGPFPPSGIVALTEDRAVFHVARDSDDEFEPFFDYVVLDLVTGQQTVIDEVSAYSAVALGGDYAIFWHENGPFDVQLLGLELATHIDVVDLRSGERRPVARNIRAAGGLFAVDRLFLWQQFKPGSFESEVRAYDPLTGNSEALLTSVRLEADEAWLRDAGSDKLLIERNFGSTLSARSTVLELRSFSGQTTRLAEFQSSLQQPRRFSIDPRLTTTGLVVWKDPYVGDVVLYDPADQSSKRFVPSSLRG